MISGVTSGWNCKPRLRPETNACGPTSVSATTPAPRGARIEGPVVLVDAHGLHARGLLVEPGCHEAGRSRLLVLEDQRARLPRCGHRSSLSTEPATARTVLANRTTISPRSSSGVVKGGAKSVWSPANPSRVGIVE